MIKAQESTDMKFSMVLNKIFLELVVSFWIHDPSVSLEERSDPVCVMFGPTIPPSSFLKGGYTPGLCIRAMHAVILLIIHQDLTK